MSSHLNSTGDATVIDVALPGFGRAFIPSTHLSTGARPAGVYQAALADLGETGASAPDVSRVVKGQQGRTYSHRSTVPSRLRISAGHPAGVETVPTASPLAVGTTISGTPRASGEEPLRARGRLGGASASLFYSVR